MNLYKIDPFVDKTHVPIWIKLGRFSGVCSIIKGTQQELSGSVEGDTSLAMQVWRGWSGWHSRIFKDASVDVWKSTDHATEEQARDALITEAAARGLINSLNELKE